MDIAELYHFLFESYAGIGVLVGSGLILSILICIVLEFRTRKLYRNHEPAEDEWSMFYDEIAEGEEEEEEKEIKQK